MEKEKERKKPTEEEREYQKRISVMLENALKTAGEEDPSNILQIMYSQISEDPKLLEYMHKDPMGWAMVAYVLDKQYTSKRLSEMLKTVNIHIEPKAIQKEVKTIETLQIKMILQEEMQKYMLMNQLKQALGGQGEGPRISILNPEMVERKFRS